MGSKSITVLGVICQLILDDWDSHVIISTSGLSIEDSYCVKLDEILLEGRCRDFTALRIGGSPLSAIETGVSPPGFRFLILKFFALPKEPMSITQSVTVHVSCLSNLTTINDSVLIARAESYSVKKMAKWLRENNISAVFCSDSVIDDLMRIAAAADVTVVR